MAEQRWKLDAHKPEKWTDVSEPPHEPHVQKHVDTGEYRWRSAATGFRAGPPMTTGGFWPDLPDGFTPKA